ncbi:tetratricopeptide repeat protein [Gramella lutea]|uniref:Tetratricopeptide repeat protein n=2 Tax=Christiangramia lutea TaxID=1607951 RepID=A0A9X1V6A9_9FLAO|nr:tetratricopeptide repeat protein [Christiangramia lutea]
MNLRPLLHLFGILCFLLLCSCTHEKMSPDPIQTKQDSSFYYFEKGKNSEGIREKISNFNKALRIIKNEKDTLITDILDYKIYYHNRIKEYDSSLYFSDSLINSATTQKDTGQIAKGYYRKSIVFRSLKKYDQQFENAFRASKFDLAIGDTSSAGRRLSEMAFAQSLTTDYIGAQESGTEALKYLSEEDSSYISNAYNTIATAYRNQGFYQDAVKEWRNALKYATTIRDSLSNLNNIALTLQDQEKYDEALKIFEDIIERSNETNKTSKARFIDNYAYTKWLQDSSAIVIDELLQAVEFRRRENDQNGLLASYDHLSDYYQFKSKRLSRIYADSLLQTAQNTSSKTSQLNALQKLIQLSPSNEIKNLSKIYIQLNDSIRKENIRAKNFFAKIRYDEKQKQEEIRSLEAESSEQRLQTEELKNQTIILSLGGMLILVSSVFGFYYLRQRHEKEKIQEAYKTESRISKKIHDELANDVYNVMGGMQNIAPNHLMDKLEHIYKRTRNISRENSSIHTGDNYLPHLVSTLSSTISENTRLILRGEETIYWNNISQEKKIILYRVLQEIMINMNKHSKARLVAIIFSEEKNSLKIQYTDNGIGVTKTNLKSGNGIQNMENRIFSIKGRLNFEIEQEKGLKIFIQIPI